MKKKIILSSLAAVLSLGMVFSANTTVFANFEYSVKPGDNLWKIAKTYLGDGSEYRKIYEANKSVLKDANSLSIGDKLIIPDVKEDANGAGSTQNSSGKYQQVSVHEVTGRQGVAVYGDYYFVSGSKNLVKYDRDWNVVIDNFDPFVSGYDKEVNHIGDIDVYNNEIYCGVELFLDGVASNIQIGIYDGDTLKLKRSFNFEPESGQTEVAGICVDPDNKLVWLCSWGDETGRYLYKYDLDSGKYIGKIHVHPIPQWFQGVVYYKGDLYVTADDGDADYDEPDHVYKLVMDKTGTSATVIEELALIDVIKHGEIEGLSFDVENNQLLVHVNRGARIVRGMPVGLYEGYDRELNEVYVYDILLQSGAI